MVMGWKTRSIQVGDVKIGGDAPVVVQSMTTSDTMNIPATVKQVLDLAEVGCQVVRITAPTIQDAEALKEIRAQVRAQGCSVPLVADIHFVPAAAMIAADHVEKVRINPGNYADRKMFKVREYTDAEYSEELERIHDKFKPLVLKLKDLGRALRIGTNHGSLSDRVLNRFGDTPEGMVASAFEFAEICRLYDFHNFCFSMKASNVGVMVRAYRLLVAEQMKRGWDYPLHLGVTEAGDGEDGRLKSSIGIGTLLRDGIGDTIRVSLTEAAVKEVPVARAIANRYVSARKGGASLGQYQNENSASATPQLPKVWHRFEGLPQLRKDFGTTEIRPDVIYFENVDEWADEFHLLRTQLKAISSSTPFQIAVSRAGDWFDDERVRRRILEGADIVAFHSATLEKIDGKVSVWIAPSEKSLRENKFDPASTVVMANLSGGDELDRVLQASEYLGAPFVDMNLSGLLAVGDASFAERLRLAYGVLQGTRRRMSKTEYISCPSCGRTLFDLEETTARIRSVTSHLKGVKIAIMGCIVNGPGEMADADFGYVGGAPGKVNLYVGKECVERNIASAEAPSRLVDLIKSHGRWVEPHLTQPSSLAV